MNIPFSPPHISQEAIDEVVDTLKSGWITTGRKTKLFESNISNYCGNKRTLAVNSATFGLEAVLRWYGVGPGDEVIIPAYTYAATANVIVHTGATPVMVDINPDDFNISIEAVKKSITKKTKIIIPVDIGGLPVCMNKLNKLVANPEIKKIFIASDDSTQQKKLNRILILSDAAHSFGATLNGKKTGNLTDISVFSFHAVKNLTTAEGGAIAFNLPEPFDNEAIYKEFNTLSLHGQNKDALAKNKIGGWRYDITEPGYKGNMTDIQAALGIIALKYYDTENLPRRKEIVNTYQNFFAKKDWAELPIIEKQDRRTSYHLYMLRIRSISEETRDLIIKKIYDKGISVNVHFQPLPLFTAYKKLGFNISDFPVSFDSYSREISIPVYQDLTNKEVNLITSGVSEAIEEIIGA